MIRINLLPEEYRRNEYTSPKVFALTLAAVIVVCSVFGWFALVYFGQLAERQTEHAAVTETLNNEGKRAKYHDDLVAERTEFSKRSDTIRKIASSRMLWTRVIDQLIDVLNNNTERHISWFSSLAVKDSDDAKVGPTVQLPGAVQGSKISRVADLFDDLKEAPFNSDIASVNLPAARRREDKDRFPQQSYTFSLKWTFKPASQWAKNTSSKTKPGTPAK